MATENQNFKYEDKENAMFPIWEYKKKYRDRDPVLNPEAYYYDYKNEERRMRKVEFDCKLKPIITIF